MSRNKTVTPATVTPATQRIDAAWRMRHPDIAAAERALKRGNRQIDKDFGHKVRGTPQTHAHAARTRQGSLARAYERGAINADQLAAAAQIQTVHTRIIGDVTIRPMRYDQRVSEGSRHGAAEHEALGAVRASVAYTTWRTQLTRPAPVLAMIIDDVGISVAARRWRMRNAGAMQLLREALDQWGCAIGDAVRDIDDIDVLIAEARI